MATRRRLPARIVNLAGRQWKEVASQLHELLERILDWMNDSWGGVQSTQKEITNFITNNPDSTFDLEGATGDNLAKLSVDGQLSVAMPLTSANVVDGGFPGKRFLTVKGTLPDSAILGTFVQGTEIDIRGKGSGSNSQTALLCSIDKDGNGIGYTGSSYTVAGWFQNGAFGTSTNLFTAGNEGVYSASYGTTVGTNSALFGEASGGNLNVSVVGRSRVPKASATNIGGVLVAANQGASGVRVGTYTAIGSDFSGNPTIPSSAGLIVNNTDLTDPIALFKNNGVDQVKIGDGVPNDNSQHFLEVVGTLPSISSGIVEGLKFDVGAAGTGTANIIGVTNFLGLSGSFTGSGLSRALDSQNFSAGTSTSLFGGGNSGAHAYTQATTTGTNVGLTGGADGGNISAGVVGRATVAKNSATNIGGAFFGRNTGTTPIEIGAYVGLNTSNPTFESAAFVADNAATTNPIALFRNNGTSQVKIGDGVPNDNSQHFLEVVGTLPSSPSGSFVEGVKETLTSAGSAAVSAYGHAIYLAAGFTGAADTAALLVNNAAAGTTDSLIGFGYNSGVFGQSVPTTTGSNVGTVGMGQGGNKSVGLLGLAITAKDSATNIGVIGFARNSGSSPIEVGGYFGLHTNNPTFASAALVADNSNSTVPIFRGRDAETDVWTIQDGGHVYAKMSTKTLTEATATAFVRISIAQGTSVAGKVKYQIQANDATDFQSRSGELHFTAVNKAGTETVTLSTPGAETEVFAESAGGSTLTNTFDTVTGTDTFDIRANATSSLTQTTLRINYTLDLWSHSVTTVTPL